MFKMFCNYFTKIVVKPICLLGSLQLNTNTIQKQYLLSNQKKVKWSSLIRTTWYGEGISLFKCFAQHATAAS